jgi:glycosyltransferase involved in cell wall biosynthesis
MSGGYGQLYDLLFILVARFSGVHLYIHHHSFAYIDKFFPLMWLIALVSSPHGIHITLSDQMAERLRARYPRIERTLSCSNAGILDLEANRAASESERILRTIAFFGNITEEKGIFEFLELVGSLEGHQPQLRFVVAGPFWDPGLASVVAAAVRERANLEYWGPKYGPDKDAFFKEIDLLVFPSKYPHEAEPLTILEAMANSIPVIAWERGCISSLITEDMDRVVDRSDKFVPAAVSQIARWVEDHDLYVQARRRARTRYEELKVQGVTSVDHLISDMKENSLKGLIT